MPRGLKRYQETRQLHFITFSCYQRAPLLGTAHARDTFLLKFEQVRQWYGFYVVGYVVMPEHVHLLISEPESGRLALVLQMTKQMVARALHKPCSREPFWQARYYDFNVCSESKRVEKLRYLHRNPVKRGLVNAPEEWAWSSFRHCLTGKASVVEVESPWTARRREEMGMFQTVSRRERNQKPQPSQRAR
jgi:putative transposase